MSEIFVCKRCGTEHEALTQDLASYLCPNIPKLKTNYKVLDQVSLNCLTKNITLSESQEPKHLERIMETPNGKATKKKTN